MIDETDLIDLAASFLAVPGLVDDSDICRMFPSVFLGAPESLRLAHALADARGDCLTLKPEAGEATIIYLTEVLALLVCRGLDPCKLAATVFRERDDAAKLSALVVAQARKEPDIQWRDPRWRSEWPYPDSPEPAQAVAVAARPPAPPIDVAPPAAVLRRSTISCVRGVHSWGPPYRRGASVWADCLACGTTNVAPPAAGVGGFYAQPVHSIELP